MMVAPEAVIAEQSTKGKTLRCGYSKNVLTANEIADAKLAMTIWSNDMARDMDITSEFFDTPAEMLTQVKAGKLDMVILTGLDYLREPAARLLEPAIMGVQSQQSVMPELLLIVNKSASVKALKQLGKSKILLYGGVGGEKVTSLWLDTLLLQEGLPVGVEFCGLNKVDNVAKAVLPVFFRKAAAAVVPRHAYENMVELNPQLGKDLLVLKTSPPLLIMGSFFRRDYDEAGKKNVLEVARTKRGTPTGRQMLTLFKVIDLTVLSDRDADSLRALVKEHELLSSKRKNTGYPDKP
ncbi:MAG TPA: PhnD/SsuA/transferrin family substrate-binding protein [Elusimicrobiales bacterium]|nr:PhnD/SsuA/transferrin family substrate-binding protein [Elusimicrobiales bacterium]